jgi:hypothetical protein
MYQGVVICVSLTQVYCGSTISERDRAVLFGREQSIGIELWLCFLSFSLLPQLAAMVSVGVGAPSESLWGGWLLSMRARSLWLWCPPSELLSLQYWWLYPFASSLLVAFVVLQVSACVSAVVLPSAFHCRLRPPWCHVFFLGV